MVPIISQSDRKRFGWFAIFLSSVYFIAASYQIIKFFTSEEVRRNDMSVLVFPLSLFLIGVGILRINVGRALFKEPFDKEAFKFIFGLICFFEIALSLVYGLALIEELSLLGNAVVLLFIIYYLYSLLFFRKLKSL